MNDLVVLTADPTMKKVFETLLERFSTENNRTFMYEVYAHPLRDPGVLKDAESFLRSFLRSHRYALVIFDKEGCGNDKKSAQKIYSLVKQRLNKSGWRDRSDVVIIDPELEVWIWSNSPVVAETLGIDGEKLSEILVRGKPPSPKDVLKKTLRSSGIPFSSALHARIAREVDYTQCLDRSFKRFHSFLITMSDSLSKEPLS